jgi:hypothetical protein
MNETSSASSATSSSSDDLDRILARLNGLVNEKPQAAGPAETPLRPAVAATSNGKTPMLDATQAESPAPSILREAAKVTAHGVPPSGSPSSDAATQVECSFGRLTGVRDEAFIPLAPTSLEAAGITESMLEALILRFLLQRGEAAGRAIAHQVRLPFLLVEPLLNRLKSEQITAYRGANSVNDYTHTLTDQGRDRARHYLHQTTYFGSAPVPLEHYNQAVKLQSVESQRPRREELLHAFRDLLVDRKMLSKIGPAVNSGRGMFLYGYPGNGKTSIAERITMAFGKYIWIPRSVLVDGEIMRLYDPLMHEQYAVEDSGGYLKECTYDGRWVRIKRPTIIAGGELTMDMLEVQQDKETGINESPLQMKSNCGVLVIDDFGRQRMRVDELLNRWIVPLEKRFDYLNLSSGKKTQVPFDQLVIFSTNLQPKDLVDDAFLRRIPYKIEVENPSEAAFRKLFEIMCPRTGLPYKAEVVDYLVNQHYKPTGRPFRNCHPRDLLLQVRNYCLYHDEPLDLKNEYIDFACENYFSIM